MPGEHEMETAQHEVASDTIDLLEARLRRIQSVIYGPQAELFESNNSESAVLRLRDLEYTLDHLIKKSKPVQDLLKLHARYPDFFHATDSYDAPSLLETSSKASIVLSAASSYPLTASSLTSILDTPIPPSSSSTALIDTAPKVSELDALQRSQMKEISSLKQRSATLLQRWYSIDVLRGGEWWADIEDTMERIERITRRYAAEMPE